MKTQTVKKWLKGLPKGLRKEALKNAMYLEINGKTSRLSTAILYSFLWKRNPFWNSFYLAMLWAEDLDNPPKKRKSFFNP